MDWWRSRRRAAARKDIDDELEAHLEARIEYLIERGLTPTQARAEALCRFGNLDAGRSALYREARRRGPRLHLGDRMHDLLQDIRYVARGLARTPAFTLGVVVTLALGLGINAAVFRVADVVLFRAPGGVDKPADVRRLELDVALGRGAPLRTATFSYPDAARAVQSGALSNAAAYIVRAERDAAGRDLTVNYIDANFLSVLGAQPMFGRGFGADEASPGARLPAAIVSRHYWQQALGSAALDQNLRITLNGKPYPVVGVMPGAFRGIELDPTDVWLPLGVGDFGRGEINGVVIPWYQTTMMRAVRVIGRGEPGVTDEMLAARIDTALKSGDEVTKHATLFPIVPVGGGSRSQETNVLLRRLTIVAAIILVIACANAVNLLLARGLRRHQEIAIRMAIGASRARVSRLLIIESALLAVAGGTAAMVTGFWTSESLRRLLFPDAKWTAGTFDQRTLIFTTVLALIAGVVAGLAPARQSTSPDLVTGLKHQRLRGGATTRFTRAGLIMVQTALSLTLLISSGLLVRSLIRLNAVPMGFDPQGLVTASLATGRYGQHVPGELEGDNLAARLAETGRAESIALASNVPFGATATMTTKVIGATQSPSDDDPGARWTAVSPNYFNVMRTRVVNGRGFTDADLAGSEPVTIINESMARAYFGGRPASNACVMPVGYACMHIVGIVEDVRDTPNGAAPPMRYYMPLKQYDSPVNGVIIRTSADEARGVASLVKSMFPSAQRVTVEVISDRVAVALRPWHSATWLFVALGALALALASVGIYSVMNYVASERIHELGVRVVLGASAADILRLVVGNGLKMTMAGCALGLVTGAAAGHYLGALLFAVSPFDPLTYALGLVGLAGASLIAVLPPAWRASRVDPIAAFRVE